MGNLEQLRQQIPNIQSGQEACNFSPNGFILGMHSELHLKACGSGNFFAKKGAMIAAQGKFKYEKRLLGTNEGSVVGQALNFMTRRLTGENLPIMEVKGSGICHLADRGQHVTIIDLEPGNTWQDINVESENLLAFTPQCKYGVTPVGVGVISQRGLFSSKLSYQSEGAQVAITSNGNPLVFQVQVGEETTVDPDAIVAWTGPNPKVTVDVNWKTLIGQSSGESYMLKFSHPGQIVIVQPYEREAGINLRDEHRPEMQNSPTIGSASGNNSPIDNPLGGGNPGGGIAGAIGGILNR